MVAVLVAAALYIQSRQPMMPVYGATVVWAIVAVAVVNRSDYPMVAMVAAGAAVIMAAGTAWLRFKPAK